MSGTRLMDISRRFDLAYMTRMRALGENELRAEIIALRRDLIRRGIFIAVAGVLAVGEMICFAANLLLRALPHA